MFIKSSTTSIPVLLVAALLLFFVGLSSSSSSAFLPVEAGSPPCNCHNGEMTLEQPRCMCACQDGYAPPYCSFRGVDMVRVEVWFNYSIRSFISGKVVDTLKKELAAKVNASLISQIEFLFLKPSTNNKTMALFDMPGIAVNWLYYYVWDAEGDAQSRWPYAKLKITGVFLTDELLPPQGLIQDLLRNTYLYRDDLIQLSLSDVVWLMGVIVMVVAIPLIEKTYSMNDEKMIERDIAMGVLDPLQASSASKYKE